MKKILAQIKYTLEGTFPNLFSRIAIIAVIILPLVYAALYLWAFWDPYSNIQNLPVAFVTEDEGYIKDASFRNLGTELENDLKTNTDLKWCFVSLDEAKAGLQSKEFYSYIYIPKDFSKTIFTVDNNHPEKAKLTLITREASSVISARIVKVAAQEVTDKLDHKISEEYIKNIFVDSRSDTENVKKAVDGAQKLSDGLVDAKKGSQDLKNGLVDASKGGSDLQNGLQSAYKGGSDLTTGISTAYKGTGTLKDGLKTLSDGMGTFNSNFSSAISGAEQVQAGLHTLLTKLQSGSSGSTAGSPQDLINGLTLFKSKLQSSFGTSSTPGLPEQLGQAALGVSSASSGVSGVITAMNGTLSQLQLDINNGADPAQLTADYQALDAEKNKLNGVPTGLNIISGQLSGASSAMKVARDGDGTSTNPGMYNSLNSLINGATVLAQSIAGLQTQLIGTPANPGVAQLVAGQDTLVGGLQQLYSASQQLQSGADTAYTGSSDLYNGLYSLDDGSRKLVDGIWKLNDGSQKLESGLTDLNNGSLKLVSGLNDAASGSQNLYQNLNDGYLKDKDKVAESKTDLEKPIMAEPVVLDEQKIDPVTTYGTGFAPYFVPLALWVGAMASFLIIPSFSNEEAHKRRWGNIFGNIMMRYVVLGVVGVLQAVILCTVLIKALGLQPTHPELFYGFTILLALLSFAIFQFLVYSFGLAGDFIGIVVLMLQLTSSAGSYPRETLPQFFVNIGPYLPMTYAVSAFRDIISGSQIDVTPIFTAYGIVIAILLLLTTTTKWAFSRKTIDIAAQTPVIQAKIKQRSTFHLERLKQYRIAALRLSQSFKESVGHGINRGISRINEAKFTPRRQSRLINIARNSQYLRKIKDWNNLQKRRK